MKKFNKVLGVSALSVFLLTACSEADVETGGSNNVEGEKTEQKQEAKKDDGSKKFNAAVSQDVMGLKINLAEIKIEKDKVTLGMNLENSTDKKLTFYPDQGNVVIGDMQLDANMFMGKGEVSGDINSGVKMDGAIVFTVPEGKTLDVKKITELKFNFGEVYDDTTYEAKPVSIAVPVK